MKHYALISVTDKTGVEDIAKALVENGLRIISTGGTAKYLRQFISEIIEISDLTGFPEILDGRVKTLQPSVYAGILAKRDMKEHISTLQKMDLFLIDVVIVNLYPFAKTVAQPSATHDEIIENIDIGGPSLIRASAKNYHDVMVITDPDDYIQAIEYLKPNVNKEQFQLYLGYKAFKHVAEYDYIIYKYFSKLTDNSTPFDEQAIFKSQRQSLRYGENPHQDASFWAWEKPSWQILHGKELSYNNYMDLDIALKAIKLFQQPTAIIFKHTNPCGIGSGTTLLSAYKLAYETDTASPYGGIVVVNRPLDMDTALEINKIFTELIIAPHIPDEVLTLLKKKKDRRLIVFNSEMEAQSSKSREWRSALSGLLVQETDDFEQDEMEWEVVTSNQPNDDELQALRFAWRTVAILKSNAIAITNSLQALGLGNGQTSRVDSLKIALSKVNEFGHSFKNAVCASDGFFPFTDSIELLHDHGIKCIIQPGGSKGDNEVVAMCNKFNMVMILTHRRHFRH